jgi:hypothetical protein
VLINRLIFPHSLVSGFRTSAARRRCIIRLSS